MKYEYRSLNWVKLGEIKPDYKIVNPAEKLPTLLIDGHALTESMAIC